MAPPMDSPLLLLFLVPPIAGAAVIAFLVRPRAVRIPIKNRHVFISGGSSGIGLALARQAAAQGARVSILARSSTRLEEARNAILHDTGVEVFTYSADVRDPEAVANAVDAAGPIDVLVCNHGVFSPQELERQDTEEVKFMVEVNLMGTFHLIKAALPGLKWRAYDTKIPSSIAIMSSQAGQVGVYGYTAYSASKFALRGLAEALQHEVISDNIRVSLIFPPDTDTPGFVEENKKRPDLTSLIAGSSGGMKADDVAKRAIDGIKSAKFIIPCNFEGKMMSIATAGLSPQSSFFAAVTEVLGAGLMRFVGLCYQWNWFSMIAKYNKASK